MLLETMIYVLTSALNNRTRGNRSFKKNFNQSTSQPTVSELLFGVYVKVCVCVCECVYACKNVMSLIKRS